MEDVDWRREHGCEHKLTFISLADANHAARKASHVGIRLRAYRCEYCQLWHLTKFDKTKKRKNG